MLQQTRASRVALAYEPFLRAFPDVARLAAADAQDVLRAWQGLGYYRRARSLHAAARAVMAAGGRFPSDAKGLARLPGVGRYTAVAIAAQAFGLPGIAVDANVRRVGARILGQDGHGTPLRTRDADIERGLGALLLAPCGGEPERRAAVPEALIELGALVCTPRTPACDRCPLAPACAAAASSDPTRFGRAKARAKARAESARALVVLDGGAVALVRRPDHGRWGGLFGFPSPDGETGADGRALAPIDHVLTHRRLRVTPVLVGADQAPADAAWVSLADLVAGVGPVPVSVLDRKVARSVLAALERDPEGGTA
jgi:A/G-specific adenine glycosylase